MIEAKINDRPQWFYSIGEKGSLNFSVESNRGIRFARKQEAELFIESLRNFCKMIFANCPEITATDHQWL
jgi:hypothetical protein